MRFPSVRCLVLSALLPVAAPLAAQRPIHQRPEGTPVSVVQFIFTSDAHYGLKRASFRGAVNVDAHVVNAALVAAINRVAWLTLPADSGVRAGEKVGAVDYVIDGGDIANRSEAGVQSASASWRQFVFDYQHHLTLRGPDGQRTRVLAIPGNHDVSNAVGFYRLMQPAKDASSMVGLFNEMLAPTKPRTTGTYDYARDKVHFSREVGGVHLSFVNVWPDSAERLWLAHDLAAVSPNVPVLLFAHDQPAVEAKHFTNPNPPFDINSRDRFENLLAERFKDALDPGVGDDQTLGPTLKNITSDIEQRGFVRFVREHPAIKAYFHGNSNYHEAYVYSGPDGDLALNVFRADSPMKGAKSSKDEKLLSFEVVSIDTRAMRMTVRECLWNSRADHVPVWGASTTVSLR